MKSCVLQVDPFQDQGSDQVCRGLNGELHSPGSKDFSWAVSDLGCGVILPAKAGGCAWRHGCVKQINELSVTIDKCLYYCQMNQTRRADDSRCGLDLITTLVLSEYTID